MFRMNWYDYTHNQFIFNGTVYKIYKFSKLYASYRTEILFLLNQHEDRFVTMNNIIDFVFDDLSVDIWPQDMNGSIRVAMLGLRKILPKGLSIKNVKGRGYILTEKAEG